MQKTISIIIPVYNEKETVLKSLERVKRVRLIDNIKKEIILVDDYSQDGTRDLLKDLGEKVILHKKNQGKGAAIRTGLKQTTGDIITIHDADLEYDPEDFNLLLREMLCKNASVVYGSRFLGKKERLFGKNKTLIPLHYLGNHLLSFFTTLLYSQKVTDMETCYKMFTRDVLNKINPLRAKRFDIEPEITIKILKRGYKIREIPITFKPRPFSEGKKIHWKDGIIALYYLIKYRIFN